MLSAFPRLVEAHLTHLATTPTLEEFGTLVLAQNFPAHLLIDFIGEVCKWGGYSGIAARVGKNNPSEYIRDQFLRAHKHMTAQPADPVATLYAINQIKHLGHPSFASKQLRFLYPEVCPVLDSIITDLGYMPTAGGYHVFVNDCRNIATTLKRCK